MSTGCLEVLNVGAGHFTISFDKEDRGEVKRAREVITDMLRRGYAIFVEVDGKQEIVRRFNTKKNVYIIGEPRQAGLDDGPPKTGSRAMCSRGCGQPPHRGRCRRSHRELPLATTRATAVGRSAGG